MEGWRDGGMERARLYGVFRTVYNTTQISAVLYSTAHIYIPNLLYIQYNMQ